MALDAADIASIDMNADRYLVRQIVGYLMYVTDSRGNSRCFPLTQQADTGGAIATVRLLFIGSFTLTTS